jgi:FKBP-type peptidyl-prolyl cis-trans isomerase
VHLKGPIPAVITALAFAAPAFAGFWPVDDGVDDPWYQTKNGVGYQEVATGTGPSAIDGASVDVHYTGMLEDGTVFDSSIDRDAKFSFLIGSHQVIRGWEEGVVGMKVGGKRRLIIPSHLGYGPQGAGPIPPGSTLYFEIELFEIILPREPPKLPQSTDPRRFKTTKSGLMYIDLVFGEGTKPKSGRRVCVDYTVWLDGELLDHTFGKQHCRWFRYDHTPVPPGLIEGLAKMRTGGPRQLRIPAHLLVGNEAIPPNTTVLYEVTLVEADE